jgi:hypothetical protein
MNNIKVWWEAHKPSAHTTAAIWVMLVTLWAEDKAFKDYIYGLYAHLPVGLHHFVVGIVIPILIYWKAQRAKQAG